MPNLAVSALRRNGERAALEGMRVLTAFVTSQSCHNGIDLCFQGFFWCREESELLFGFDIILSFESNHVLWFTDVLTSRTWSKFPRDRSSEYAVMSRVSCSISLPKHRVRTRSIEALLTYSSPESSVSSPASLPYLCLAGFVLALLVRVRC